LIITILKTCGKFCAGCISLTQLHHTTFYFVFVFKTWQKAVTALGRLGGSNLRCDHILAFTKVLRETYYRMVTLSKEHANSESLKNGKRSNHLRDHHSLAQQIQGN